MTYESRTTRQLEEEWAPLSAAQRRLWILHQFDKSDVSWNRPLAVRLKGELDIPALAARIRGTSGTIQAARWRSSLASRSLHQGQGLHFRSVFADLELKPEALSGLIARRQFMEGQYERAKTNFVDSR